MGLRRCAKCDRVLVAPECIPCLCEIGTTPQMTFCQCGYQASSTVTQEMTCPLCHSVMVVRSKEDQGQYAWGLLHSCTTPTEEWYQWWLKQVPTYDCACRENWRKLTLQDGNDPPFGDHEAFSAWAIRMHNAVNRELGKPQWPVQPQ